MLLHNWIDILFATAFIIIGVLGVFFGVQDTNIKIAFGAVFILGVIMAASLIYVYFDSMDNEQAYDALLRDKSIQLSYITRDGNVLVDMPMEYAIYRSTLKANTPTVAEIRQAVDVLLNVLDIDNDGSAERLNVSVVKWGV